MFKIKYFINKSPLHGLGIFSNQEIKKGQIIYIHNDNLDLILTEKDFDSLDEEDKNIIFHYGYFDKRLCKWRLDHDDIRFCNHSKNPNITLSKGKIIAKRDIPVGEELLQDYCEFEGKESLSKKNL